ncbi:Forkhead transcription factor, partial [Teratosphaeriaceae sp. CCFEE 6253]
GDSAARGSPEKRSARRASLARAATSTGILADITGAGKSNHVNLAPSGGKNLFALSPFMSGKAGSLRSPVNLGSPVKHGHKPPPYTSHHPGNGGFGWADLGLGAENVRPATSYAALPATRHEAGGEAQAAAEEDEDEDEDATALFAVTQIPATAAAARRGSTSSRTLAGSGRRRRRPPPPSSTPGSRARRS